MIFDHRTYTVHPHRFGEFLKIYEELGFEVQTKHLGNLVGWYTSMDIGELHQVVHIWAYKDLQDRAEKRAKLAADPAWGKYLAAGLPCLQKMENKILSAAPFYKPDLELND
ncbi:NIPSNAP family protein [Curvivirga aplysinae]|uniref:NIPSNAP family protein n=1 Tax=Curvivirga aplysinae TaxID=2529852 RepID=UPI0012BD5F44|nr:NIPSNAP family protein [Curvivirga aplysinae]MTI08195.1 NIPSNAP family protein [Curvivirga aplysinae]